MNETDENAAIVEMLMKAAGSSRLELRQNLQKPEQMRDLLRQRLAIKPLNGLPNKMAEAFWNAGRERYIDPPPDYPSWEDVRKIDKARATTDETARCVRKAAQVLREPTEAMIKAGDAAIWRAMFDVAFPEPPEDFEGHRF